MDRGPLPGRDVGIELPHLTRRQRAGNAWPHPDLCRGRAPFLPCAGRSERRARYAPANQWPRSGRRSPRQLAAAAERGSWPSSMNGPAGTLASPPVFSRAAAETVSCSRISRGAVGFRLILDACFRASLRRGALRAFVTILNATLFPRPPAASHPHDPPAQPARDALY